MNPMQRVGWLCSLMFALMSLGSITVLAQTESLQDQLNSAYKHKILLIRNFYSGTNLEFEQNGVLLGNARSAPWTLAFMQIASVTASAQGVEVVGNRVGALFQKRTRRNGCDRQIEYSHSEAHLKHRHRSYNPSNTQQDIY